MYACMYLPMQYSTLFRIKSSTNATETQLGQKIFICEQNRKNFRAILASPKDSLEIHKYMYGVANLLNQGIQSERV